jgi:lysophospholipase
MISFHFLNQTSRGNFFTNDSAHGAGQLWSQIPNTPAYQQHLTPFPLICADSRPAGSNLTTALPPDPVVYEVPPARPPLRHRRADARPRRSRRSSSARTTRTCPRW